MAVSEKEFKELTKTVSEMKGSRSALGWVPSAAVAIALAAIGWCFHLSMKVTAIEQQLADGGNTKLVAELKNPKSPQQLQANLTTVSAQIQTARAEGKKPEMKKIEALSGALTQVVHSNPRLPEVWQAAAQLVSYKSPHSEANLPDCNDTTASQLSWVPLHPRFPGDKGDPPPHQFTFSHCRLNLDAPIDNRHFTPIGPPDKFTIVCDQCLVAYSGGPIPLMGLKGYVNLIFNNCTFSFVSPSEPPPAGKSLIQAVLTSPSIEHVASSLVIG